MITPTSELLSAAMSVEHYDSPNCDCVERHEYDALRDENERLKAECDQYQAKLNEVWKEVAILRVAAEKLQAYADAHPCDHGPACPTS